MNLSSQLLTLNSRRVFVGLSGGVDSAVSAYLLQQAGYDVHGVFIQTWTPEWMECNWRDDRRDAMRVALHLGIPFHDLDLVEEYKTGVADYMINEYRLGRTPNPDVMCNRVVKFGGFLQYALAQGADYVATGHYARVAQIIDFRLEIRENTPEPGVGSSNLKSKISNLLRGIDPAKDQSYFLWTLTNEQLKHVLFPIGHLKKTQVREIADRAGLPVAMKKDSQGVCFLGHVDMREFLSHYIELHNGAVMDESGDVIGTCEAIEYITIGQRLSFNHSNPTPNNASVFVIAKDMDARTVTVSSNVIPAQAGISSMQTHPLEHNPRDSSGSYSRLAEGRNDAKVQLSQAIFRTTPDPTKTYTAQIRYHGEYYPVQISDMDTSTATATITCADSVLVAPGQSVVLYDGDICIGGGIVS